MRILATCYQGLGNNVVFTPAIAMVSEIYPYVPIDVVSKFPDLYEGMPFVNPIRMKDELANKYDIGLTALFGPEEILEGIHIDQRLSVPKISFYVEHEIMMNARPVIEDLGYNAPNIPPQYVPIVDVPRIDTSGAPIVGICDGSKPRSDCQSDDEFLCWNKKRWPYYYSLISMLVDEGVVVVIFGTNEDGPDDIPKSPLVRDMRGQYTVEQLASAMQQCDVVVTNDTGPMHVADAAGVKTIAIFGPTSIIKNGPVGANSMVIDAPEILGIDEAKQGTQEFSATTISPSLQALKPDMVRDAIGELQSGGIEWL